MSAVTESVPLPVRGLVQELSVAPLPTRLDPESGHPPQRYLDALVIGVHDSHLSRRIADATATCGASNMTRQETRSEWRASPPTMPSS